MKNRFPRLYRCGTLKTQALLVLFLPLLVILHILESLLRLSLRRYKIPFPPNAFSILIYFFQESKFSAYRSAGILFIGFHYFAYDIFRRDYHIQMNMIFLIFLSLYIPNQDNISLFPEVLFSDNFLLRLLKSFFGIWLSRRYDIGSYIRYEPHYITSCFHYIKIRTEETGKYSHPHLYRWGFPARLKNFLFFTIIITIMEYCSIFNIYYPYTT